MRRTSTVYIPPVDFKQGIPRTDEYLALLPTSFFKEIEHHSNQFVQNLTSKNLKELDQWDWPVDPLHTWSRQWEYPFCISHLKQWQSGLSMPENRYKLADLGAGLSFLPKYLHDMSWEVICCDADTRPHIIYQRIGLGKCCRWDFLNLPSLSYENNMFDAILCISVLEHLAMEEILVVLSEVFRVLKPGGLFILTFDIRLDSKTGNSLNIGYTHRILEYLGKTFAQDLSKVQRDVNALSSFHNTGLFLTTDWIRQEYPKLLPWKLSMRGVIKQISRLHWPSRPFESLGVCCLALERP